MDSRLLHLDPVHEELEYGHEDCNRFVQDMADADLEPYHYRGRNFWEGPAVNVACLQDALSSTKVKCQWDQMGMGWVVYPIAKGTRKGG